MDGTTGLTELSHFECVEHLRTARIGRIVLTHRALPIAHPVAFAMDGDDIIFRTGVATQLGQATRGMVIALQADVFDETLRCGWSVVATGLATPVLDQAEEQRLFGLPLRSWVEPVASRFIRLVPTIVAGTALVG